jgi:hypothetical protein
MPEQGSSSASRRDPILHQHTAKFTMLRSTIGITYRLRDRSIIEFAASKHALVLSLKSQVSTETPSSELASKVTLAKKYY